jgi:hypothetical protein
MDTEPNPSTAVAADANGSSPQARLRGASLVVLIGVIVVLGLLGRWLVADGVANSFLADWLPWMSGTEVTLYYGDPSGDYLVPISRNLTGDEENVDALAEALFAGPPVGTGLLDLIPGGTTIQSISYDGANLDIDVSGEFLEDPPAFARHALVHSMASWPGVEEVTVSVDGVELEPMTTNRLLFFYDPGRDVLAAKPTSAATGRDILAEYLAGSGDARLTGLPLDVEVLQFESAPGSGLIKLNFRYTDSLRAMATDDGEGMRRTLEGLIATLTTATPETNFVYLDFEGHATLGLGQCANLLRTVQPTPEVLNDERLLGAS